MEKKNPMEEPLAKNLVNPNNVDDSLFTKKLFIFLVSAIVLGAVSGYVLSSTKSASKNPLTSGSIDLSSISKGTVIGSDDTKTFKDTSAGDLKEGGIQGEGQFHLVRPGGISQNVYLTSSTVDLSKFVGKKIKVWGETQKAQYAGWLMDVGRLEVL